MLTLNAKEKDDSKITFSNQKVLHDWNKQKTVNQNPYEKGQVPSITTTETKQSLKSEVKREVKTGGVGDSDKYSELEKLASLRDKGVITQKEFDLKKKQLLGL
ncbi:predicted protein [Naegleria gruberi]|uniref:Predicted protein n=1 Tax=Naegleria gruberi TaxID=5762 RepID=D2UZU1_NAEGR|nr:uncharacterized protein NAEGRDRAFT_62062 [Naegleria gruberi]EFC50222.1 predicted protein [Naegleria gruberi]|eukprot:XP_002682966.1 predicted protein [Naegleria gruberi strain NEG-M]